MVRIARYLAPLAPNAPSRRTPGDRRRTAPIRRSESVVLDMADPAGNHNGGMIAFGPDGRLWAGTGDGGSGGDPWDNARNPASLLGKMLRIDVGASDGGAARRAALEIWALGLRNPWRFSFDRATGEIWIGDVGQNAWEEIDVADSRGRRRSTSAGRRWRASTATTRARAATPRDSSCRSTSTATTPAAR